MKHLLKVHGTLFLVNLIYGANYTIAKEAMPAYIQPFGFVFVRVCIATMIFLLVNLLFIRQKVNMVDVPRLALCGLFGVAINQLLFLGGLNITTPINASLIMITTPILVLVVSNILLKERITWLKSIGILFGATGAATIILFGGTFSFGSETIVGDLMVFLNAASYGVYLVIVKPLMKKYNPFTVIFWVFFFGLFIVAPFGYGEFTLVDWHTMPFGIWLSIAYVVIGTTFLAYTLNIYALSKVNPSLVGTYIYLQPVLASIIALSVGKDEITMVKVIATVLIFAGVYMVSAKAQPITKTRI